MGIANIVQAVSETDYLKAQPPLQILDDSSDDEIIIPSAQKRKRNAPVDLELNDASNSSKAASSKDKRKSQRSALSPIVDVEPMETPRPRRKLKRKAESSPVINLDSDSEEPVMSSPAKRKRLIAGPKTPETPRDSSDQDQLDIEEDVRDLQDSGTHSQQN